MPDVQSRGSVPTVNGTISVTYRTKKTRVAVLKEQHVEEQHVCVCVCVCVCAYIYIYIYIYIYSLTAEYDTVPWHFLPCTLIKNAAAFRMGLLRQSLV